MMSNYSAADLAPQALPRLSVSPLTQRFVDVPERYAGFVKLGAEVLSIRAHVKRCRGVGRNARLSISLTHRQ